jgi:hypothetical protein
MQHVLKAQTIIRDFSAPRNFVPNRIHELFDEEVISDHRDVLLLSQDLLVGPLHKVGFKRDWHFDVDVVLDIIKGKQLNFCVVLRNSTNAVF